ncbi:dephospho-CoA kinase [Flavobacterium lacus]|jgi:dephospho-CoA kinase|uniref:Dephospho-CoA kinase n=1 Tax=Flavobacterium lacus TaxID=1353778 RepID=A0A328WS14_9FLAO|nr:dephospho-CoA kinase [Flavobacterium lacus]RAR49062.1 dephospho-CoA kinase [Flavobacterium lacus]
MTKIIGLTGGIGSGKTTVARMFMAHGIPVYIADEEAKKLMESDVIIKKVEKAFGKEILTNQKIDRAKLASIVFNKAEKLEELNKIIHPAVQKHFKNWLKNHNTVPFVIKEAAILFETGGHKQCDKVITVVAPQLLRIERVILRDKSDKNSVLDRINNQWTDEKKVLLSDFVIENIDLEKTTTQVSDILKVLNKI